MNWNLIFPTYTSGLCLSHIARSGPPHLLGNFNSQSIDSRQNIKDYDGGEVGR